MVARGFGFGYLTVQFRNLVTNFPGLVFFGFGFVGFFLGEENANFFGEAIPFSFQPFNFANGLTAFFVESENFGHLGFIPCPARRQPLTDHLRLLPNQLNVKHRRIIELKPSAARVKPISVRTAGLAIVTVRMDRGARSRVADIPAQRWSWKPRCEARNSCRNPSKDQ